MGPTQALCPFASIQWNGQRAAAEVLTPATEVTIFVPQGLLPIQSDQGMYWSANPRGFAPQGIYGLRGQPAAPSAISRAMIPTSIRRMVAWV